MKMHNPPHPGEVIKELCLEPLNMTVIEFAEALGVSHQKLSAILNGKANITPEIAIRLGKALGTSPESWLNQQMQYDLWQTEKTIRNIIIFQQPKGKLKNWKQTGLIITTAIISSIFSSIIGSVIGYLIHVSQIIL